MYQATNSDIRTGIQAFGLMVLRDCGGHDGHVRTITCGFTEHGLPELICLGLPTEHIFPHMNNLFYEMVITKTRQPGPFTTDDWFTMQMQVVEADRKLAAPFAHGTERYYRGSGKTPQYMQMAWPDATGKFPWEPGFDEKYKARQPNLKSGFEPRQEFSMPTL